MRRGTAHCRAPSAAPLNLVVFQLNFEHCLHVSARAHLFKAAHAAAIDAVGILVLTGALELAFEQSAHATARAHVREAQQLTAVGVGVPDAEHEGVEELGQRLDEREEPRPPEDDLYDDYDHEY